MSLGDADGCAVGRIVGLADGTVEGISLGDEVGDEDGGMENPHSIPQLHGQFWTASSISTSVKPTLDSLRQSIFPYDSKHPRPIGEMYSLLSWQVSSHPSKQAPPRLSLLLSNTALFS